MKKKKKSTLIVFAALSTLNAASAHGTNQRERSGLDLLAAEYSPHHGKAPASAKSLQARGGPSNRLLFLSEYPLESQENLSYAVHDDGETPAIDLKIGGEAVASLNRLLESYKDRRLALTHNGEVIFTPQLGERLDRDTLHLTFDDRPSFERVLRALAALDR